MRCIAILMLALLVSSNAWAQANTVNVIQQCRSFAECTIVWGGCSDVAINKQYIKQFQPTSVCSQTKSHDPRAVPTCEDNVCVVASQDKGGVQ